MKPSAFNEIPEQEAATEIRTQESSTREPIPASLMAVSIIKVT